MSDAFIALGSNLENPSRQIETAFEELNHIPETRLVKRSSLYQTAPVGLLDQPDFINAVAQIETTLTPYELFDALMSIEQRHDRKRAFLNAPRTLDLDLLLYDDWILQDKKLTVPHPRMFQRTFVLIPLLEIAPDYSIPEHGSIAQLAEKCSKEQILKINPLSVSALILEKL